MTGLVTHTVLWVFINLMCVILIAAAGGSALEIQDADDDIGLNDVSFIDRYKAGFGDSGLPVTFAWVLGVLNSVWLGFIFVGWFRGQH